MSTNTLARRWVEADRIDVCVDCYMATAGYDEDDTGYTPDCEPLGLLDGYTVDSAPCCDQWETCDGSCGGHDGHFSWSWCQGCGSTLGGDRYTVVIGQWTGVSDDE